MSQDLDLYYTAPDKHIFDELKQEAIKIWQSYDDTYGYASGKISKIKDLENIKDNFMYMFAMFDVINQRKLINNLSDKAKNALIKRLPLTYKIYL